MKLRTAIIVSGTIPILITFIISVASQYIATNYSRGLINTFADQLFDSQLMYVKLFTLSLNFQLSLKIQKYVEMLSTLNHFQSRLLSGLVVSNSKYVNTNLNLELLYDNKENPTVTQIFLKNKYATSVWAHQNVTNVLNLSQVPRIQLTNISIANPLQRSYQYQSDQESLIDPKNIQINSLVVGFGSEGMIYASAQNSTYRYNKIPNCNKGPYVIDARCLQWFQLAYKYPSTYSEKPLFTAQGVVRQITSGMCKTLKNYNQTKSQDEIYYTQCVPFYLNPLSKFFENFINQTNQSFIIEPRFQSVLYNSKKQLTTIDSFYQTELQTNQNTEDAIRLNNTINDNFSLWVYNTSNSYNLEDMMDTKIKLITQLNYTLNGTQFTAILNPIMIYDKLPQYVGVQSPQPKGFNTNILYLQINYLSNEALKRQATTLINQTNQYFLYSSIFMLVFFLISVTITVLYTIKLNRLLEIPLEQLTIILKQILQEIKSEQLYDLYINFQQYSQDMFLSKETTLLFQSFEQIFQMLIYTTENFFSENQTVTLLRLFRNIEFFNQFKNNHAVGIIHNSIGIILMSQEHFFHSLEHFSQSILYAQYEIQEYLKGSQDQSINQAVSIFSFSDDIPSNTDNNPTVRLGKGSTNFSKHKFNSIYNKIIYDRGKSIQKGETKQFDKLDDITNNKPDNDITSRSNSYQQGEILGIKNKQISIDQVNSISNLNNQQVLQVDELTLREENQKDLQNNKGSKTELNNPQQCNSLTYDRNVSLIFSTSSQEQLNNLFLNVYYRKKNYVLALLSFQENHDRLNSKLQHTYVAHKYNFWSEIKNLLKQLIVMTQHLDIQEYEIIELLTLISKCYLNSDQKEDSKKIIDTCSQIGKSIKSQNITHNILEEKEQPPKSLNQTNISHNVNKRNSIYNKFRRISVQQKVKFGQSFQLPFPQQDNAQTYLTMNRSPSNTQINGLQNKGVSSFNSTQTKFTTFTNVKILEDSQKKSESKNAYWICQKLYKCFFKKDNLSKNNDEPTINHNHNLVKYQQPLSKNDIKQDNNTLGLESFFEQLRKMQMNHNLNVGDHFLQSINLALVDYQTQTGQLFEAACIITEEFEKNVTLYSHRPFQMIEKLQDIFKIAGIGPSILKYLKQKFKKNITQRVCIVIGEQQVDESKCLQSLNLFSNLVSSVLTKADDDIGIILYNKLEKISQTYIELQKVKQIKSQIQFYISDLYQKQQQNDVKYQREDNQIISEATTENQYLHKSEIQQSNPPSPNILSNRAQRNKEDACLLSPTSSPKLFSFEQINQPSANLIQLLSSQNKSEFQDYPSRQASLHHNETNPNILNSPILPEERSLTIVSRQSISQIKKLIIPIQSNINEGNHSKLQKKLFKTSGSKSELTNYQSQLYKNPIRKDQQLEQYSQSSNNQATPLLNCDNSDKNFMNSIPQQIQLSSVAVDNCQGSKERNKISIQSKDIELADSNDDSSYLEIDSNQESKVNRFNLNKFISFKGYQHDGDLEIDSSTNTEGEYNEEIQETQKRSELNIHLLLRKAILQLVSSDQYLFKRFVDKVQEKQSKVNEENQKNNKEYPNLFSRQFQRQQNYVIFIIETFSIHKDYLFFKLCECLLKFNIKLLVLSHRKGGSFIEKLEEGTFIFESKEIIKIFYSISSVQTYLNCQRFNISKYIYPTYVQHF